MERETQQQLNKEKTETSEEEKLKGVRRKWRNEERGWKKYAHIVECDRLEILAFLCYAG